MRWLSNNISDFRLGDRRIVKRFLLFPKKLNGIWRFFENASWLQKLHYDSESDQTYFCDICWMDIEINEEHIKFGLLNKSDDIY